MPPMRIPQQTIVAAIPKANSSRQNSHKDHPKYPTNLQEPPEWSHLVLRPQLTTQKNIEPHE